MPEMDGVEALKTMRAKGIPVRVIVFTAFDTDERILDAVQAGAEGYLVKGAPREELFEAIRVVYAGGSLLQPIVMSKLLHHISQREDGKSVEALSPREHEVLQLMERGLQNKEIAPNRSSASERSSFTSVRFRASSARAIAPKPLRWRFSKD
jgi:two-component system, NarL family, response regulator LiaR